jgi:hypothetical protein
MMEMEQPWYWAVLELDAGSDERAVKRAYARQLKNTRPDEDADAFQRLRMAYEYALGELRQGAAAPAPAAPAPAPAASPVALEKIPVSPPAPVVLPVARHAVAPDALAHAAWNDFLANGALHPHAALEAAQHDERLQGFDARDAFELLAARHAASDACPPALRETLADHFDWNGRGAAALYRHPDVAAAVSGRYAADRGWEHLEQQSRTDPVLAFLARDTVPDKLPRRWDAHFIGSMRATLQNIRWRHADLLEHRLNHDVFAWWEAQVADKRYFRQTAGWSSVAGLGLWALCMMLAPTSAPDNEFAVDAMLLILCQCVTMGVTAWFTLRPPEPLLARAAALQIRWFGQPLLEKRYDRKWQAGWMPPFAILALALLVPDPHPALSFAVALGLSACAAMAVLATSLGMTGRRFCIAFALAAFTVLVAGDRPGLGAVPEWSLMCFGLCLFTVFLTVGEPLYHSFGWNRTIMTRLRLGWLVAGLCLCYCVTQDVAVALQTPALMLLLLTGVLIARYNAGLRFVWFALMAARAVSGVAAATDVQRLLITAAFLSAYFVVSHLLPESDN